MIAVTTFPQWAWGVYAESCLRSWVQKWPGLILVYYEGDAPPPLVAGIECRPLDEVWDRTVFLKNEFPAPSSFLKDTRRFCHKVFAQLDALKEFEQVWWLDADVEMKRPVPIELLEKLTNQSFVTYLGRNTYTETGVIGFNKRHPDFADFEKRYRSAYMDGLILKAVFSTDCHAFDYARNRGGYNLTPDGIGVENVLEDSPLASYLVHHKGPRKLKIERSSHALRANVELA